MKIERVDGTCSLAELRERFFHPEIPVVIKSIDIPRTLRRRWSRADFLDELEGTTAARKVVIAGTHYWTETTPEELDHDAAAMTFRSSVERFIPNNDIRLRDKRLRFFGHCAGYVTPWHYDSNGIHVLHGGDHRYFLQQALAHIGCLASARSLASALTNLPFGAFYYLYHRRFGVIL